MYPRHRQGIRSLLVFSTKSRKGDQHYSLRITSHNQIPNHLPTPTTFQQFRNPVSLTTRAHNGIVVTWPTFFARSTHNYFHNHSTSVHLSPLKCLRPPTYHPSTRLMTCPTSWTTTNPKEVEAVLPVIWRWIPIRTSLICFYLPPPCRTYALFSSTFGRVGLSVLSHLPPAIRLSIQYA